jgi:hypothetical protein
MADSVHIISNTDRVQEEKWATRKKDLRGGNRGSGWNLRHVRRQDIPILIGLL